MNGPAVSEEILRAVADVFRRDGYEGATLSRLSNATGLSRSSLYHHFPLGKQQMVATVLEGASHRFREEVLNPLGLEANVEGALALMAERLRLYYENGSQPCLLASLTLSLPDGTFGRRIGNEFADWIGNLAGLLSRAGIAPDHARERAEDAVFGLQGALIVCRATSDIRSFERHVRDLPARLLAGAPPASRAPRRPDGPWPGRGAEPRVEQQIRSKRGRK